jgi:hypothetical protein
MEEIMEEIMEDINMVMRMTKMNKVKYMMNINKLFLLHFLNI